MTIACPRPICFASFSALTPPTQNPTLALTIDEGHEFGNHMTRDFPSVELSQEEFRSELFEADRMLAPHGETRRFRPGSGWYSEDMIRTLSDLAGKRAAPSGPPPTHRVGFDSPR